MTDTRLAPGIRELRRLDRFALQRMKTQAIAETASIGRMLTRDDHGLAERDDDWRCKAELAQQHWAGVPQLCDAVIEELNYRPDELHRLFLSLHSDVAAVIKADEPDEAVGLEFDLAWDGMRRSFEKINAYLDGDQR